MSQLFYNLFGVQENTAVVLCGDASTELLSHVLAKETAAREQKALICANFPIPYPIEGQILVNVEPELLKKKLESDPSRIIYLCTEIKEDQLHPISGDFFKRFAPFISDDVRFIIQIKSEPSNILQTFRPEEVVLVNSFNYQNLKEALSDFLSDFQAQSDGTFTEDLKSTWNELTARWCAFNEERFQQKILFINQIKSLIDENRFIPLARNLSELYQRILIGDINDYKIKEI